MKTNNYLNLCIEQAAKSPFRYCHGAIIVRGGKVIGQGYNDYRPGFDGGPLKTGQLSICSLDDPAISELKKKHKLKREPKIQAQEGR
jgi:deoxycytidylate deaminase